MRPEVGKIYWTEDGFVCVVWSHIKPPIPLWGAAFVGLVFQESQIVTRHLNAEGRVFFSSNQLFDLKEEIIDPIILALYDLDMPPKTCNPYNKGVTCQSLVHYILRPRSIMKRIMSSIRKSYWFIETGLKK